jgi:AmmeMemoRadiSam system protein B
VRVRNPAVAGLFYPDEAGLLASNVDDYLLGGHTAAASLTTPPKAIVVPHAGYVYSGPIAGSGYAAVEALAGVVERVVLLGPAHRVPLAGLAVPSVDAFATPLGPVAIDTDARATALTFPGVVVDDVPHAGEHSLEVHLPFVQRTFGVVRVLPIVVGRASTDLVATVLDALWGGAETLIVVSSDLSHYEPYESAQRHDRRTAEAVVTGAPDAIDPDDACGAYPVRGLLDAAARHDLAATLLDLRNSGDTAGPRDRVVGYGAFAFSPR